MTEREPALDETPLSDAEIAERSQAFVRVRERAFAGLSPVVAVGAAEQSPCKRGGVCGEHKFRIGYCQLCWEEHMCAQVAPGRFANPVRMSKKRAETDERLELVRAARAADMVHVEGGRVVLR